MNTIKMNFSEETHWVLKDEENRIIAIIVVPSGSVDISVKIKQAIDEDMCLEGRKVELEQNLEGGEFDYEIDFSASIDDENSDDDDGISYSFTLVKTALYKA